MQKCWSNNAASAYPAAMGTLQDENVFEWCKLNKTYACVYCTLPGEMIFLKCESLHQESNDRQNIDVLISYLYLLTYTHNELNEYSSHFKGDSVRYIKPYFPGYTE